MYYQTIIPNISLSQYALNYIELSVEADCIRQPVWITAEKINKSVSINTQWSSSQLNGSNRAFLITLFFNPFPLTYFIRCWKVVGNFNMGYFTCSGPLSCPLECHNKANTFHRVISMT